MLRTFITTGKMQTPQPQELLSMIWRSWKELIT